MEEERIVKLPQMISIPTCIASIATYADIIEGKTEISIDELDARLASVTDYVSSSAGYIAELEEKLNKAMGVKENE